MANKDLVSRNDNALSVENANKLLNLREKVKQNTALVSDEWLDRLIKWADERYLPSKKDEFHIVKYPFQYLPEWNFKPFYKEYFPRDKDELRKLNGLYFQWHNFDDLPNEFGNLTELEFLYIHTIKKIPNSITKLKKLKVLGLNNIYNNQDTEITLPQEFSRLSNLEILGLDFHHFECFPSVILELDKLRALSLRGCGLSSIPQDFEILARHIDKIFLNNNPLKNVPTALCKCYKLNYLNLPKCEIVALPEQFANLQNLQTLDLSENPLKNFPSALCKCLNLECLKLPKCELSTLPKQLVNLKNLETLDLSSNPLENIPLVLCKCFNLKNLHLYGCKLSTLPEQFANLQNLQSLTLSCNQLKNIPTALYKCTKLKHLSLRACYLNALPEQLANLQNLEILDLNFNTFDEFPQVIFELKNLKRLYIELDTITPKIEEKLREKRIILR